MLSDADVAKAKKKAAYALSDKPKHQRTISAAIRYCIQTAPDSKTSIKTIQ